MLTFITSLFGCSHKHCTFPMSAKSTYGQEGAAVTYVVCLDCGKEFPYDWDQMKRAVSAKKQYGAVA